jgi:hypothetical protein
MLVSEAFVIDFLLQVDTERAEEDVGRLKTELMRVAAIVKRLTGDEDLARGIGLMQRTIATINAVRVAYLSLQAAMGPIGWITAGLSIVTAGFAVSDTVMSVSRGY